MNDEAIAYVAIDRLLRRYADLTTRGTHHEIGSLAMPDAVFIFETFSGQRFEVEGTQDFIQFATKMTGAFDFYEYVPLNFVVDFGAEGTARGRAYNLEISYNAETDEFTNFYGQYDDDYVQLDGRWYFARRHYRTVARRTNDRLERSPMGFAPGPA
jgi:SnoaL-like domain